MSSYGGNLTKLLSLKPIEKKTPVYAMQHLLMLMLIQG
jgi:hypothetical protein